MDRRFLSLLLIALLAGLSAQETRPRGDQPEGECWSTSTAPTTPARPAARLASVGSFQRTVNARAAHRHTPPEHDPALASCEVSHLAAALPARCCAAGLASSGCGARELAFPYDATAPPARA